MNLNQAAHGGSLEYGFHQCALAETKQNRCRLLKRDGPKRNRSLDGCGGCYK